MATTSSSKLGPAPGGGTLWHVPNRKRPVAQTTSASSQLVAMLVEDGARTFAEVKAQVAFDPDVEALCDIMAEHGVSNHPLRSDGYAVCFDS